MLIRMEKMLTGMLSMIMKTHNLWFLETKTYACLSFVHVYVVTFILRQRYQQKVFSNKFKVYQESFVRWEIIWSD